jgi:hypothetical protein
MEAYEPRSFRFIELLTLGDWRMKLYGIAWRRELPRAHLLETAKRIAAEVLRNAVPNNQKVGFIGAHDAERHAWCSSTTGGMRTSCFIAYFFRLPTIRTRWLRRQAPIYRSAFGICASNRSSALPGSNTSCANQTRLTFMVILASDSMKRPRSADATAIVQQWAKF